MKTREFEDVRKGLLWLRRKNPHVRLLMTNLERFENLHARIQTLVPLGRKDTPVRIVRSPRAPAATEESIQLKDTIGAEDAVLVLVGPAELPRTCASLDLLSETICEGTYRAESQGNGSARELHAAWGADMSQAANALRGAPRSHSATCI